MKLNIFFKIAFFTILYFSLVFAQEEVIKEKEEGKINEELKSDVIQLSYIKPFEITRLLRPMQGLRGRMEFNNELMTILITDYPKKLDEIRKVVEKLDVKPISLEFTFKMVIASEEPTGQLIPDNLKEVVAKVDSLSKYNTFKFLDTSFIRATSNRFTRIKIGGESGYVVSFVPHAVKSDKEKFIHIEDFRIAQLLPKGENRFLNPPPIIPEPPRRELPPLQPQAQPLEGRAEEKEFNPSLQEEDERIEILRTSINLNDNETSLIGVSKIEGNQVLITMVMVKVLN